MLLQILRQTLRPCPGTGKQGNLVAFFLILFQILHQKLKAAVIRSYTLHRQIVFLRGKIPLHASWLQCRQRHCTKFIQFFLNLGKFTKPLNRKVLFPFFFAMCAAGGILFLHAQSVFQNTVGFIQKQKHFFFGKIIHKRYHLFAIIPLHSRINGNLIQIFQRALTLCVKASDRIHFISPQLNSPWILFCKGINIYYTTAHRKLSRHFHLSYAFISKLHKGIFQHIHVDHAVRIEMKHLFPNFFQGHQIVHTAVNAGNHSQFLLLQKCLYHTHSLADQQISLNICLEKEKILRRVKHGIFVIKAQVLEDFLSLALISCDHKAHRCFAGKPMDQMCLLGFQAACDLHNALIFLKAFLYFFKFCHPLQGLGK